MNHKNSYNNRTIHTSCFSKTLTNKMKPARMLIYVYSYIKNYWNRKCCATMIKLFDNKLHDIINVVEPQLNLEINEWVWQCCNSKTRAYYKKSEWWDIAHIKKYNIERKLSYLIIYESHNFGMSNKNCMDLWLGIIEVY